MKPKRLSFGGRCPHCGGRERYSSVLSRHWRPVVFMRGYSCRNCHSQYMVFSGCISFLTERGFRSVPPGELRK
jgi:hypothetical protein